MALSPASSHGGGIAPNSIVLSLLAAADYRAAATHDFKWDTAYDNTSDYNTLTSVPAALGLSILLNGTAATITTTADGVWAFTLGVSLPADVTVAGFIGLGNVGLTSERFGPAVAAITGDPVLPLSLTEVLRLPSGAITNPTLVTTVAATSNPWSITPYLAISRLA